MSGLERIIYQSVGTGRTDSLLNMVTILAESQRNNARDGLTGALAAHDGLYIQVLEGSASALEKLLHRLRVDLRHTDVQIIDRVRIDSRAFDGWSMANARIDAHSAPQLEALMAGSVRSASAIVRLMQTIIA